LSERHAAGLLAEHLGEPCATTVDTAMPFVGQAEQSAARVVRIGATADHSVLFRTCGVPTDPGAGRPHLGGKRNCCRGSGPCQAHEYRMSAVLKCCRRFPSTTDKA